MAKAKTRRLILVRTGPTDWENEGRLCGGGADLALCDEGRQRLTDVAAGFAGKPLALVLAGPDEASQQTASAIADATDAKVRTIDDLGEIHLGLWQGLLKCDLEDRCPSAYKQWLSDPSSVHAPEGESLSDALARILAAIERAADKVKGENAQIGVVLRPMAHALLSAHIRGVNPSETWSVKAEAPDTEEFVVDRARLSLDHAGAASPA